MKSLPHAKFIVAGFLIFGSIGYLMWSGVSDSMIYYYTVSEVCERGEELTGKGIRVSGHVQPGSIVRGDAGSQVAFVVFERDAEKAIDVTYRGVIPDTFKDNAEVVVEGTFDPSARHFEATTLLAKCPSKYEEMGDEHPEEFPAGEQISRIP